MKGFAQICFACLMMVLLYACTDTGRKNIGQEVTVKKADTVTDPFVIAARVQVISYRDVGYWDSTLKEQEIADSMQVIKNGKLIIPAKEIKDDVTLTATQVNEVERILCQTACTDESICSCIVPNHAIVFYDKNNTAIAAIGLSFGFREVKVAGKFPPVTFCRNKEKALAAVFKAAGVKKLLPNL